MPLIPGSDPQQRLSAGAGAISAMQHALGMGRGPAAGTTPIFGGVLQNLLASTGEAVIPIFQEGLAGGMAGFQVGGENVWHPTTWGNFMVRPKVTGEGSLRAVGGFLPAGATSISERLSFGAAFASQIQKRAHLVRSGARGARTAIQQSLTALDPIQWAAFGNARDYLRATSTFSEEIAGNLVGLRSQRTRPLDARPRVPKNARSSKTGSSYHWSWCGTRTEPRTEQA